MCPVCGAVEIHPLVDRLVIRCYKYTDEQNRVWSQCLRCSGLWNSDLTVADESKHDPKKGWFCYE
jgi:hypothetical protein